MMLFMVKVVIHMLFLIIMQESKLIHMILCLKKKYWLCVMMLIQEVFDKNKNYYCHNIFLEKCGNE